jgi:L-lysine 2,3-aminomutase
MLSKPDLDCMLTAMAQPDQSRVILRNIAESIRANLNPHPAGQLQQNVPKINSIAVPGMQHKYRETVLFFPTQGQFCHSFCTYCFRWAQFTAVGSDQQFQSKDSRLLTQYISLHPQVRDVLFTGGDPMVMSAALLKSYILPLLSSPGTQHLDTIRIGTKSLAYWPYRYLSDPDSKDVLSLFEEVGKQGKHLTVQAHFSHPRELETPAVREAMRLIQMTGAKIRTQSPLIRGVNDSAETWARMWNLQVRLGAVPYYM